MRNPDMVTGVRVAGRRAHPPDRVLLGVLRRAGTGVETGAQVVRGKRIGSGLVEEEHRISGSVTEPAPQLVIAGDVVVVPRHDHGKTAAETGKALRRAHDVAPRDAHRLEKVSRDHQEVAPRIVRGGNDSIQTGEARLHQRRPRHVGVPRELHAQVQV